MPNPARLWGALAIGLLVSCGSCRPTHTTGDAAASEEEADAEARDAAPAEASTESGDRDDAGRTGSSDSGARDAIVEETTADASASDATTPAPSTDGGAGRDGGSAFMPGPGGCTALQVEANVASGGYTLDRYSWSDATCARRSAGLARNTSTDAGGSRGGFLRTLAWSANGKARTANGTGVNGWNGFGYVVSHYANTADTSQGRTGTFRTLFSGAHHAIHEFKWQMSPGGPVDVTVHWFFATGRSAPIYAITFDSSRAGADAVTADARAPYGDFAFEGPPENIKGIGWGDKYRFVTTGAGPVTLNSAWDYTKPNTIPYVQMWAADAEMGLVQTQSFERQLAGGDYGNGVLASQCWGKTSATKGAQCSANGQTMPVDWLWPYQLNQWELPNNAGSHRIAWGSSYGAVGQRSVSAFGRTISGYPYMSYAVYVVLDLHAAGPTFAQASAVERAIGANLSASTGSVNSMGPGGVGRSDAISYAPAGYNASYGVYEFSAAASGKLSATLDPRAGALSHPILHVTGFRAAQLSKLLLDGVPQSADAYYASVDTAKQELWLTLAGTVSSKLQLELE